MVLNPLRVNGVNPAGGKICGKLARFILDACSMTVAGVLISPHEGVGIFSSLLDGPPLVRARDRVRMLD
jgi:hypothetical protein